MSKKTVLLAIMVIIMGGGLLVSTVFSVYEMVRYPDYTMAATSSAVTVAAEIASSISCSGSTASTDFGTWTAGSTEIKTASPNASTSMSCPNSSGGCSLYVKDAGGGGDPGLYKDPDLIESPNAAFNASTTLSAGTEGYGIQAATNTAGSGGTLGLATRYKVTGDAVGGLLVTNTTIASSSAATTGREIVVTHKAAIAATTPSGSYSDTITYECTEN